MSIFSRDKNNKIVTAEGVDSGVLAELALKTIQDGVIMTDRAGIIKFINPAAARMTDYGEAQNAIGLDFGILIEIETKEGRELSETENPFIQAMRTGQPLERYECCLITGPTAKRVPIAISVLPVEDGGRIITFRDITKELAEEGEQTEFISTASHEMRTPVASIEGYLSLALNPQTAAIDDRARGYLTAAHTASQHLGKLFRDLLDITKLDDGHLRPHFVPVEMTGVVKQIADDYIMRMKEAGISYRFGATDPALGVDSRRLDQVVYGYIDIDFLREIIDNLIDNAIKYTPKGGSVYINVLGDGDRALINVTDTGIGISADDLQHIFQKFYRADNSDTRTIGGTGLGLYLVKQRVEAMGGRVWAESAFGEGSTFFVSLPRISGEEYEKRMIAVRNMEMVKMRGASAVNSATLQEEGLLQNKTNTNPINSILENSVVAGPGASKPPMTVAQLATLQPTNFPIRSAPPNSAVWQPGGSTVEPPTNGIIGAGQANLGITNPTPVSPTTQMNLQSNMINNNINGGQYEQSNGSGR